MKRWTGLKILAAGSYCEAVDRDEESLPDLKDLVKESTGRAVRRVSRFVQLALVGAGRCVGDANLEPNTAVYFSSCRGDTEVTRELLNDLVKRAELPGPLTFVNSVSNAACFHVASVLNLKGRSNFVTNYHDAIAAAFKSAWLDIIRGEISTALVGSVDACALPLSEHRERIQAKPGTVIGEGSHWFLLAAEKDPRPALARLTAIANFPSGEDLEQWLKQGSLHTDTLFAAGQYLSEEDGKRFASAAGLESYFRYRDNLPYYDSPTGAAIDLFTQRREPAMLHINSDPSGRYSLLLVER